MVPESGYVGIVLHCPVCLCEASMEFAEYIF